MTINPRLGRSQRDISVFYPDINNASVDDVIAALHEAGATILHTTIAWSVVEPRPGEFDFSAFRGPFERVAAEGFQIIIAIDSSGRPVVPTSRVVTMQEYHTARPPWLVDIHSDSILSRDFDGTVYNELDYSDRRHLPDLVLFYERTLAFISSVLPENVYGVVAGVNAELEIKYGQLGYHWRSYGENNATAFATYQTSKGRTCLRPPPRAEFNNRLENFSPAIVDGYADWQSFREAELVGYITPLCALIRQAGYRTIGYFGQFMTQHDAIYASGVVRRCKDLFDIVSFDYNFYNGHGNIRNPWIVPAMVSLGRSIGFREIKIGLYVERYRDMTSNQLDWSIIDTLRSTLELIEDGDDVVSLEVGGIEVGDLGIIRSAGLSSKLRGGFELGGFLPRPRTDAVRVGVVASFDNHYLWHGDFSNDRDHLSDITTETFRVLRLSRDFIPFLISADDVESGRYSTEDFDLLFFPHTLAMSDGLVGRIKMLSEEGMLVAQDFGAGAFTPDGAPRPLTQLDVFGIGAVEWIRSTGHFTVDGQQVALGESENTYFSYARLAPLPGVDILMPEAGYEGCGLIARSKRTLAFGFLPQIMMGGLGVSYWSTFFLDTIYEFVLHAREQR